MNTMFRAKVREKWQITIPKKLREIMNIDTNDYVAFWKNSDGQVIMDKAIIILPNQAEEDYD